MAPTVRARHSVPQTGAPLAVRRGGSGSGTWRNKAASVAHQSLSPFELRSPRGRAILSSTSARTARGTEHSADPVRLRARSDPLLLGSALQERDKTRHNETGLRVAHAGPPTQVGTVHLLCANRARTAPRFHRAPHWPEVPPERAPRLSARRRAPAA